MAGWAEAIDHRNQQIGESKDSKNKAYVSHYYTERAITSARVPCKWRPFVDDMIEQAIQQGITQISNISAPM